MNTSNEIVQKLKSVLEAICGSELHDFSVKLRDIGLDSLKTMDLVLGIEDAFNIEISDEDLIPQNLETPQSILNLLYKILSKS